MIIVSLLSIGCAELHPRTVSDVFWNASDQTLTVRSVVHKTREEGSCGAFKLEKEDCTTYIDEDKNSVQSLKIAPKTWEVLVRSGPVDVPPKLTFADGSTFPEFTIPEGWNSTQTYGRSTVVSTAWKHNGAVQWRSATSENPVESAIQTYTPSTSFKFASISPNQKWIAIDQKILDIETGAEVLSLDGFGSPRWFDDSTLHVSSKTTRGVRIVNVATGKQIDFQSRGDSVNLRYRYGETAVLGSYGYGYSNYVSYNSQSNEVVELGDNAIFASDIIAFKRDGKRFVTNLTSGTTHSFESDVDLLLAIGNDIIFTGVFHPGDNDDRRELEIVAFSMDGKELHRQMVEADDSAWVVQFINGSSYLK